jgi:Tol biopolymer transport system component
VISPDGTTIAFISERDGPSKVFLMNRDGTAIRRLTQGDKADFVPVFDDTGSNVFFSRRLAENSDVICAIGTAHHNERRLTEIQSAGAPVAATQMGTRLYFLTFGGTAKRGGAIYDLVKLEGARISSTGIEGAFFNISADEQWVAFVSDVVTPFRYELHVSRIDGADRRALTDFGGAVGYPCFSPDGTQILFILQKRGAPGHGRGRGDIYTISVDGKDLRRIGPNWID